jgi:NitT/TauT family transport system substrate-binding protein
MTFKPQVAGRSPASSLRRLLVRAACALSFCSVVPAEAAPELRIAVSHTPMSLPLYVAQENGYFAAEGIEVRWTDCLGGHRCLQGVFDGQQDLATASELPVMFNAFGRTDHAIIATFVSTADDLKLVTRPDSGVSAPADLAGKKLGAVAGTSSQYFLDLYLLGAGVDPRGLQIVPLQPEQTLDALRSGRVDAVAIWEPYAYLALQGLGPGAKVVATGGGYIETFNLVARTSLLDERAADLARLLRAVERAEQFIEQRPADAKGILRRRLQLDQRFIDWVWPGLAYRLTLDQSLISTMESQARWAMREGHIQGKPRPNFLKLVHPAVLKLVKPTAVGVSP